jgi:hypothetical protein
MLFLDIVEWFSAGYLKTMRYKYPDTNNWPTKFQGQTDTFYEWTNGTMDIEGKIVPSAMSAILK